jgi:hypothetical protein
MTVSPLHTYVKKMLQLIFSEPSDDGFNLTFVMEEISRYISLAMDSSQPLRKISTRIIPWIKGLLVRNADNLTVICEPIF